MKVQITLVLLLALVNAQTGGWKKQNPTIFQARNSNIINEAQIAVQNKYQLEEQGFEFEQVVSIETQIVAGTNYNIVLQYGNEEGQILQYDIIIYSAPWNGQDQITKCEQVDGQSALFSQNQQNNNYNEQQQKLQIKKSSPLRLMARKLATEETPLAGGWWAQNPKTFLKKEKNIIDLACTYISQEYSPEDERYEFHKILEVQTQIVQGTNYNITLLYSNGKGSYQNYNVFLQIGYISNQSNDWQPPVNTQRVSYIGTYSGPLTAEIQCDCEDFTSQTECNNVIDCTWGTSCTKKACKNIDVTVCDTLDECSVNNSGECEAKQVCSNYEVSKPILCMIQKGDCGADPIPKANGKYACAQYISVSNCSSLPITACNNKYIDDSFFCWINASTNKCDKFYMDSCSGIPMEVCADLGCDATGTTCKAFTCASFKTEASCTIAKDGTFGTQTLCKWDATTASCGDRSNTSDYTQNTCSNKTGGRYYWSNDECVSCRVFEPKDSKSLRLLFLLPVILTIIQ